MGKMTELNFRSFLADPMRDYLDYFDNLGYCTVATACNLRRIDSFLVENGISGFEQCDYRLWAGMMAEWQGRIKATTLKNWRGTFRGFWRFLIRQGWATESPAAAFALPKYQHYRPYVFSIEELRRFFDFLRQQAECPDPPTSFVFESRYVFYHLIYACGLRVSEAARLDTSDYSREQRTLFIRPSKFLKDRLIPIGSRVCSNLECLLELRRQILGVAPKGPFFLTLRKRRPYSSQWGSIYFKRTLQQLGIYRPEITDRGCTFGTPHLHELRRAFAVHRLMRWYREQVDVDAKLPLLATYLGHSCFENTKIYLTLTQQLLSQAGNRFARRFDRLDWLPHDDPELR